MIESKVVSFYGGECKTILPVFSKVLDFVIEHENHATIIFEHEGLSDTKEVYFLIKSNIQGMVFNGPSFTTNVMNVPISYYVFYKDNDIRENRDRLISDIVS